MRTPDYSMLGFKEVLRLSFEKGFTGKETIAAVGSSKTVVNEFL